MSRDGALLDDSGILHVYSIAVRGRVPVPNGSDAEYAVDDRGQRWVLKRNMLGLNDLLAEAIGYNLCKLFQIPSPQPALYHSGKELLWMTQWLDPVKHWTLDDYYQVRNLSCVGDMLALDVLVGNNDRHAGNILLQTTGSECDAYSIDMEQSWVQDALDIAENMNALPRLNGAFAKMIPIEVLADPMRIAAEAMRDRAEEFHGAISPACQLVDPGGANRTSADIAQCLKIRAESLTDLVERRIEDFRRHQ